MKTRAVPGTVYLIHFDRPLKHARHYIGWASDLSERIESHRKGTGARLMAVLKEQGIGWTVARVWEGETRDFERKLKNWRKPTRICPVCRGECRGV